MADAPTAPEVPVEEKPKEATAPKLDSRIPLSQQSKNVEKLVQAKLESEKTSEEDKPEDKPKANDAPNEDPKPDGAPLPEETPEEEDEDEPETPQQPVELGEKGAYILSKMRTFTTLIKDGDGVKEVQWKDTTDLPRNFEFANDSARTQFQLDLATQTRLANDAAGEYDQQQLQENIRKFEAQEAQDVADDIAYLQRRGILKQFQYEETDPKFNSDPAVKVANEIYDLYKKINLDYATKYNGTGRMYRISYRDAADKYFARENRRQAREASKATDQPTETPKKTPKATAERNQVARQQGAPQGGEPNANKFRPRPGMRLSDINRLVTQGRI